MRLKLGGEDLALSRIELRLALGAVPTLALRLKDEHDARSSRSAFHATPTGRLEWQGIGLDVSPYGFERMSGRRGDAEAWIHAVLIEDGHRGWFETRPEAAPGIQYGIHQNQGRIGGWTFLHNTLGRKVHVPANDYKTRIDAILPIGTCLPRPVHQDNLAYLNTVLGHLTEHIPELVGWCGVLGSEEPLRFVFFDDASALDLDASWELLTPTLPSRYAGQPTGTTARLRHSGMFVKSTAKMALLQALARHGLPQPLSGFLAEGSESDLVYLPGPVRLADRLLLCEAVRYDFDDPEDSLMVTLELSSGFGSPTRTIVPTRLEGHFDAWDSDDDARMRVLLTPPDDATWRLMDAQDSDRLAAGDGILARFVTPTTPNDVFAGLYVTHAAGDRVVFDVQPFHTPLIHGSFQVRTDELEAATLSLNTELLALSTSDSGTPIGEAHGIVMEEKQIVNRAGSDIIAEADTITLDQNVVVTKDSLDVKSKTDVANQVQIDGKLEVGGA